MTSVNQTQALSSRIRSDGTLACERSVETMLSTDHQTDRGYKRQPVLCRQTSPDMARAFPLFCKEPGLMLGGDKADCAATLQSRNANAGQILCLKRKP